jgi:hypothetical protein
MKRVSALSYLFKRHDRTVRPRRHLRCCIICMALLICACTSPDNGRGASPEPGGNAAPENSPKPSPDADRTKGPDARKGPSTAGTVTVAAAGDISESELGDQRATSDLVLEEKPDRVLVLGDSQYPNGSPEDYSNYYDATWGRFEERTSPAPGNHDQYGSSGYEEYFGPPGPWYSFDLGNWHLVSLDSNHADDEEQHSFMDDDLESDDHLCDLAYWHHPRWSSGSDHGSIGSSQPLWKRAVDSGVDIVLAAHDHVYERFDRLDREGRPAPDGTLQIVVGTGGAEQHDDFFADPVTGSNTRLDQVHGVLFLKLKESSFSGEYTTVDGEVLDRFEDDCR